jgi:hypothetical protein
MKTEGEAEVPGSDELDIDEYLEMRRQGKSMMLVSNSGNIPTHEVYKFQFSSPRWNPLREPRSKAKKRILAQFEDLLEPKLEKERELIGRLGCKPISYNVDSQHFDWLARYQVQGLSFQRIAEHYHRERQTVTHGIKLAAKVMLGSSWKQWLRPPGKPGRPKKQ